MTEDTAAQSAFELAVSHHQAGRLAEAEKGYREILKSAPSHAGALHLLGMIGHQTGNPGLAVELIGKAVAIAPDYAEAHNNLGNALKELGRIDEAAASYRRCIEIVPGHAMAHNNLGSVRADQGEIEEAIACYRKALELAPDYALAHYNLGSALRDADRPEEAIDSYRRALEMAPDHAAAHNNLGNVLKKQGKFDEAIACYRRALEIAPDYGGAHYNLGNALRDLGRLDEAVASYRRGIEIVPDYAMAHNNLGNVLEKLGDLDEAAKAYKLALAHTPGHAIVHSNLGLIHEKQGDFDQALACYRRAIELDPNLADAHTNLGNALFGKGEFGAAVAAHERAIALSPDFAEAHCNLGNALKAIGTIDEAIASYRKAVALVPEYGDAYCNLGAAFQERGDDEAAIACYEKVVAFDPGFANGYKLLLTAKKISPEDPIVERIKHRIETPATSPTDRAAMLIGLANVYDAAGDYATAFATASRANHTARIAADYSSAENNSLKDRIIRLFPKEIFSKTKGYGNDSRLPIFIVGMPRSGKTLVERLLTAHPMVSGAHENLNFTDAVLHLKEWLGSGQPYPDCMDRLTPDEGRQLGDTCIESLRKQWPDATYLTITHPFNYLYLGLIQLVLPQARIIHCRRDPLDTCLRCYFRSFKFTSFKGLRFTLDLSELGDLYLSYKQLMDHWRAVLPRPILDVEFERLVSDPVTVGQEIYAYCGLPPDATGGSSAHADMLRVLADIGASETGLWRHYAEYLEPLRKKLADGAPTGGERAS